MSEVQMQARPEDAFKTQDEFKAALGKFMVRVVATIAEDEDVIPDGAFQSVAHLGQGFCFTLEGELTEEDDDDV